MTERDEDRLDLEALGVDVDDPWSTTIEQELRGSDRVWEVDEL